MGIFDFISKSKYLKLEKERDNLEDKVEALREKIRSLKKERDVAKKNLEKILKKNAELQEIITGLREKNYQQSEKLKKRVEESRLMKKMICELTRATKKRGVKKTN